MYITHPRSPFWYAPTRSVRCLRFVWHFQLCDEWKVIKSDLNNKLFCRIPKVNNNKSSSSNNRRDRIKIEARWKPSNQQPQNSDDDDDDDNDGGDDDDIIYNN